MNNLLQTIKENNENIPKQDFTKSISIKDGFAIQTYFNHSRIKELEVLVEMIEGEKDNWNGSGEYYANVSEALDDVIQTLQSTINQLKN